MRWRGETEDQTKKRLSEWHKHFCLVPTQMPNGDWIWLEHCWRKLLIGMNGRWCFQYRDGPYPEFVSTPPPPR